MKCALTDLQAQLLTARTASTKLAGAGRPSPLLAEIKAVARGRDRLLETQPADDANVGHALRPTHETRTI